MSDNLYSIYLVVVPLHDFAPRCPKTRFDCGSGTMSPIWSTIPALLIVEGKDARLKNFGHRKIHGVRNPLKPWPWGHPTPAPQIPRRDSWRNPPLLLNPIFQTFGRVCIARVDRHNLGTLRQRFYRIPCSHGIGLWWPFEGNIFLSKNVWEVILLKRDSFRASWIESRLDFSLGGVV